MMLSLVSSLSALNAAVHSNPLAAAVGLTSVKTAASDLVAQAFEAGSGGDVGNGQSSRLDLGRVAVFWLYGAIYLGAFQFFLFTKFYPRMFPLAQQFASKPIGAKLRDTAGAMAVAKQVMSEAVFHWPWLYVPSYYAFQEVFAAITSRGGNRKASSATAKDRFRGGWTRNKQTTLRASIARKIKANWWDDLKICYSIWIPACAFSFGMLPVDYQVPFYALVSFFYTANLSLRRAGGGKSKGH